MPSCRDCPCPGTSIFTPIPSATTAPIGGWRGSAARAVRPMWREHWPTFPATSFGTDDTDGVFVHLYATSDAVISLPNRQTAALSVQTGYPFDGEIAVTVNTAADFALHLRIPYWCESPLLTVNAEPVDGPLCPGTYAVVRRAFGAGDTVRLSLPMPPRLMEAHPYVTDAAGRVALARGPLLYCVEAVDHPEIADLRDLRISPSDLAHFAPITLPDLPAPIVALRGTVSVLPAVSRPCPAVPNRVVRSGNHNRPRYSYNPHRHSVLCVGEPCPRSHGSVAAAMNKKSPSGLMVGLLAHPSRAAGPLPTTRPRFTWIPASPVQTAYQLRVGRAESGAIPVWDSGRVASAESVAVAFGGKLPLPPGNYQWQVKTWGADKKESDWSEAQPFRTGTGNEPQTGIAAEPGLRATVARYALEQTERRPVRVSHPENGRAFIDFGRAAFAGLRLILGAANDGETVTVHLGEASDPGDRVRRSPGGSVRYLQTTLTPSGRKPFLRRAARPERCPPNAAEYRGGDAVPLCRNRRASCAIGSRGRGSNGGALPVGPYCRRVPLRQRGPRCRVGTVPLQYRNDHVLRPVCRWRPRTSPL